MVSNRTILAIKLATRGFGYVVLDGQKLIDWGTKETRSDKERRTLKQLEKLIAVYTPKHLLLPDYSQYPRRQTERILNLTKFIATYATQNGLSLQLVSWPKVCAYFRVAGAATKHEMALKTAERFPELASFVPPFRKPWMSEHHRMCVFQAAALALSYLEGVVGRIAKREE